MKNSRTVVATVIVALVLVISSVGLAGSTANASHVSSVGLGTTAPFAILAGAGVTSVPTSVISGNVGLSPTTGAAITGLTCAEVTGTIYAVDAFGPAPCGIMNPGLLTTAKTDWTTAYNDAAGRGGGVAVNANPLTPNELAGQTLTHGVYTSGGAMLLSAGGTLTLNGGGDPNAVFIFQLSAGAPGLLTVMDGSTVSLINQAQACNVFWKVNSAEIGTTAKFKGTILAATSITVADHSTVEGRLLADTGNVTLIMDTIIRPTTCATAVAPIPPTRPPFTVAPSATPTVATATPIGTAAPTATPIGTAAATVAPTAAAAVARTASPAGAGVQVLPSTSTDSSSSPLILFGIALIGTGFLVLRRRTRNF